MKKKTLLGLGAIWILFSSLQASAGNGIIRADLLRFEIDGKLIGHTLVDSARIEINQKLKTARLTIVPQWNCPPEMACVDSSSGQPLVFEAPIIRQGKDRCGSEVIVVQSQQALRMEIRNHMTNSCPSYRPMPDTEIILNVNLVSKNGRITKTSSLFEGGRLE